MFVCEQEQDQDQEQQQEQEQDQDQDQQEQQQEQDQDEEQQEKEQEQEPEPEQEQEQGQDQEQEQEQEQEPQRNWTPKHKSMWCLTGDTHNDTLIRHQHFYETAPSIHLARALLDLCGDFNEAGKVFSQHNGFNDHGINKTKQTFTNRLSQTNFHKQTKQTNKGSQNNNHPN